MRVITLVDNRVSRPGLLAEHGLAMLIDTGHERILFDTGQGMALPHNCQRLGIDLRGIAKIVLSHGHYDHTGGLHAVLDATDGVDVYAHPDVFQSKHRRKEGRQRYIGIPFRREALEGWGARLHLHHEPTEIASGIWLTGEVPRATCFEAMDESFCLVTKDGWRQDELPDDLSLCIDSGEGITVLLGCAHAGVVNVLHHIQRLLPSKRVIRILGGTHLVHADETRLRATVSALKQLDIAEVGASHCTGSPASSHLAQALGERWKHNDTGAEFQV